MYKLIQLFILPGIHKFTFDILGSALGAIGIGTSLLGSYGQHQANKSNMAAQEKFAKYGLSWRINDAKRHNIHPLAAIGASPGPSPTIPMQNTMGGLSSALNNLPQTDAITEEMKRHALNAARDEASDRLYRNHLVVPVDYKGHTLWVFNPRFQSFGTFANAISISENADLAKEALMKQLDSSSKSMLETLKQKFNIFK